MNTVEVSDLYVAHQGEGANLGRYSLFLRLRRCVLACDWCDTKYTWDKNVPWYTEYQTLTVEELASEMVRVALQPGKSRCPLCLVVTGGEPLIWQRQLAKVIPRYKEVILRETGILPAVEVETSGMIRPLWLSQCSFNVSPKLRSSGNARIPLGKRINEEATVDFLNLLAVFKPVVSREHTQEIGEYIRWLLGVARAHGHSENLVRSRIYLMPEAISERELVVAQREVIALANAYGVNCTTRMHVLAFGNMRGI